MSKSVADRPGKGKNSTPIESPSANGRRQAQGAADVLISTVIKQPMGQLTPSIYETGRLVSLAPWLRLHAERVSFLLTSQDASGRWGGPAGYALVPTLSATEALLATLFRADHGLSVGRTNVVAAAHRGLRALFNLLRRRTRTDLPDTPAIEIIVPTLVSAINSHLDRLSVVRQPGLESWCGTARLIVPRDTDPDLAAAVRAAVAGGTRVPEKVLHSLEVVGAVARLASSVKPTSMGSIGASPAATAAWLGAPAAGRGVRAMRYLERVVARHGGPVPSVIPITAFERAWVIAGLAEARLLPAVDPRLPDSIEASLGEDGTPGGAGLPPDADTTGVAIAALRRLGRRTPFDSLWRYETDSHFRTWPGERTPSPTTNAHVLDALVAARSRRTSVRRRLADARATIVAWLSSQQRPDGSWTDKWHASPYYATNACVSALVRSGGQVASRALRRSVAYVLGTQHGDGSWGHWGSTMEETAYAVQTLLHTTPTRRVIAAVGCGRDYLLTQSRGGLPVTDGLPLWHDKDLYQPIAVVRCAILCAIWRSRFHTRNAHIGRTGPFRSRATG